MKKTIITQLITVFKKESFTLKQAYEICPQNHPESVRARIYESLGDLFIRVEKGVYEATLEGLRTIFIEGEGRDLSFLEENSIDAIITDYPWLDKTAHKGGNRNFANSYEGFQYSQSDFNEKACVLKPGSFLVEFMPLESESNWQELARIKQLAVNAGLQYYAKVPYIENNIRNTGRTSKAGGDILIFTKGKARALRPDAKKNKANGVSSGYFMSGAAGMLPVQFEAPLPPKKELRHQSMKSLALIKSLLGYFTKEEDVVLDQFSGSFVVSKACQELKRYSIGIEKDPVLVERATEWFNESGACVLHVLDQVVDSVKNISSIAVEKIDPHDWKNSCEDYYGKQLSLF